MIQTEKNLMKLFEAYQIIKDDPTFSDKERWVYLTMLKLPPGVNGYDVHTLLQQRRPFMDKFLDKLVEKKLWPIPVDLGKEPANAAPEPEPPKPVPAPAPAVIKPKRPTCEGCGLEGTIDGTRSIISGIILFEEGPDNDIHILCSTCRCKKINPVHGTETEEEGEEDQDY